MPTPGPMISDQAVDVEGLDAGSVLDVVAHGLGPGLGPENADAQGQLAQSMPVSRPAVDQVQKIAGRAADGGDAEILHDHDLPVGVAAGGGDHRGPQRFGAVVRRPSPPVNSP